MSARIMEDTTSWMESQDTKSLLHWHQQLVSKVQSLFRCSWIFQPTKVCCMQILNTGVRYVESCWQIRKLSTLDKVGVLAFERLCTYLRVWGLYVICIIVSSVYGRLCVTITIWKLYHSHIQNDMAYMHTHACIIWIQKPGDEIVHVHSEHLILSSSGLIRDLMFCGYWVRLNSWAGTLGMSRDQWVSRAIWPRLITSLANSITMQAFLPPETKRVILASRLRKKTKGYSYFFRWWGLIPLHIHTFLLFLEASIPSSTFLPSQVLEPSIPHPLSYL